MENLSQSWWMRTTHLISDNYKCYRFSGKGKIFDSLSNSPNFYMLVGIPASGKTGMANRLREEHNAAVHSSDEIRAELFNDETSQIDNVKVFELLHKRVVEDLRAGKNVVYDATNLSYKRRMSFLQHLSKINCHKTCIFMATPFENCVACNKSRERTVPFEVLDRMYKTIWIPQFYEGWNSIELVYPKDFSVKSIHELFNEENGLNFVEQDNPHHKFTVGHHCLVCASHLEKNCPEAPHELHQAALFHDIGKAYTKSFTNKKGEITEIAHYYEHHHVSAYMSLFYTEPQIENVLEIANYIQWHMKPFEIEKTANVAKAQNKFKTLVGDKTYKDIMFLHDADVLAH